MHKLEDLKKKLCRELEEYAAKDKLDLGALEVVDKLAHAVKNLDRIIEGEDGGYSGDWPGDMRGGNNRGGNRMGGMSYARGRGRNAKRDSMGRYSRAEDETIEELRDIMNDVDDERIRRDIKAIIEQLERA